MSGNHGRQVGAGGPYTVDVRGAQGIQVGEGNTQIIYSYTRDTWTDRVAPPPLASVSGQVESPYRGLAAFGETDAPFYFGREEAAGQVLERMSHLAGGRGLLVVSGVSGAGKSSLLRAGVLPRLRGAGLAAVPEAAAWPCLVFSPGRTPLDELAVRVALLAGTDAGAVRRGLAIDPAGFTLAAWQAVAARTPVFADRPDGSASRGRLLLVVDQFEQLFTQCEDEEQRQAFITALHAAATGDGSDRDPTALVVLGVRADFEARCAAYPELAVAVQERYLVTPMTERQLRMAITGPARAAGSQADDELAAVLLSEVRARQPGGAGAGVLPLLSHALDQAWRSRTGPTLTLADYERTGGIEGAVTASAERAYSGLSNGQRAAARPVFIRLVATSADGTDTADRVTQAELTEGKTPAQADDVNAVLEAFAAERLLALAADSVEISHEALLTAWPLLRDTWLAQTHADRSVRTQLRTAAAGWAAHHNDPAYLYRGTLLDAADGVAARSRSEPERTPAFSRVEQTFLRASGRARRRTAQLGRAAFAVLVVLALTAGGLALWANQQRGAASGQRDQAIGNDIVSEAEQLSGTDPSLAAQLLLTAYRKNPSQDIAAQLISTENQLLTPRVTTDNPGKSMAFSPSGNLLAVGGGVQVTLWNVTKPALPLQLKHSLRVSSTVSSIAFGLGGKILVVGTVGGKISLWNVGNPARSTQIGATRTIPDSVTSIAVSPDGRTLAIGGEKGMVWLWDVSNPSHPRQLVSPLHAGSDTAVETVAFSPRTDHLLAAGTDAGEVVLWNVSDPADPRKASQAANAGNNVGVTSVAFSPNGFILAVGSTDGAVGLWSVPPLQENGGEPREVGNELFTTVGSDESTSSIGVQSLAFSPDSGLLAVGDSDGTITLWSTPEPFDATQVGQSVTTSNPSAVTSLVFSPDGSTMAVGAGDGTIGLWSVPATTLLTGLSSSDTTLTFSPDGKTLVTDDGSGDISVWDASNPARPKRMDILDVDSVLNADLTVFSANGKLLAVGGLTAGAVTLFSMNDPARLAVLGRPLASPGADSIALSPYGDLLAVGAASFNDDGGSVELLNVSDPAHPRPVGKSLTSTAEVQSVDFSADGKTLVVGYGDGSVRLWNVSDPAQPRTIGHLHFPGDSANGDTTTGSVEPRFLPGSSKTLAVGNDGEDTVTLWNVSDPAQPSRIGPVFTAVNSWDVSPDDKTLAIGTLTGTVERWNISDPRDPATIQPLTVGATISPVNVTFSPDGTLFTSEPDGAAQAWELDVNDAINRICALTAGQLTVDQWKQYVPQLRYDPPCRGG